MAKKPLAWPADAVTRTKIADLIPYTRNARTHSDAQIAQLVASIREWGWTMPILVDEAGGIIAGHGRVLAAEAMGLVDVPTMTARGWSDAKRRAYAIADNKLALNAGWDDSILAAEFADLKLAEFDLRLTGFSDLELDNRFSAGQTVDDLAAEWEGMPEFANQDKTAFRTIAVHFKDQEAVDGFAKINEKTITDATRMLWFPEVEIERYVDKRYESVS